MLDLIIHFNKATDKKSAAKFLEDHGLIATESVSQKFKKILRSHIYRDQSGHPVKKATKYVDGNWNQFGFYDGI